MMFMGMAERRPAKYICAIVRVLEGGSEENLRTIDFARS